MSINSQQNYTHLSNYQACSSLHRGSNEVQALTKDHPIKKKTDLIDGVFRNLITGLTISEGVCSIVNTGANYLLPPPLPPSLLDRMWKAGFVGSITNACTATMVWVRRASVANAVSSATFKMKNLVYFHQVKIRSVFNTLSKTIEKTGPNFYALLAIGTTGLAYSVYSLYSDYQQPEPERPPLIDETGRMLSAIIFGAIGGLGTFYNNYNHYNKGKLAKEINDLWLNCLGIIENGSLLDKIDENLENKFIADFVEDKYTLGWSLDSFELNILKFNEFNFIPEEVVIKVKLTFLMAIANLSQDKRSAVSTREAMLKTILSMNNDGDKELVLCSRFFIGRCYAETGEIEKAKRQYDLILENSTNEALKASAIKASQALLSEDDSNQEINELKEALLVSDALADHVIQLIEEKNEAIRQQQNVIAAMAEQYDQLYEIAEIQVIELEIEEI